MSLFTIVASILGVGPKRVKPEAPADYTPQAMVSPRPTLPQIEARLREDLLRQQAVNYSRIAPHDHDFESMGITHYYHGKRPTRASQVVNAELKRGRPRRCDFQAGFYQCTGLGEILTLDWNDGWQCRECGHVYPRYPENDLRAVVMAVKNGLPPNRK